MRHLPPACANCVHFNRAAMVDPMDPGLGVTCTRHHRSIAAARAHPLKCGPEGLDHESPRYSRDEKLATWVFVAICLGAIAYNLPALKAALEQIAP
ncbi:MAG TPA: hypothetical protein VFE72_02880 [Lysobacter sp.]|nr:hypothetical protein [Lysobacter sp.]